MTLEAALAYVADGYPVFPVGLDKTPLTAHGFKDASLDPDVVTSWWTAYPNAGIGIPTGATTGVVVLDVDPRHGGTESFDLLVKEHGSFPIGPITRTGGGGRHFWFKHPGGNVPNAAGFRPGLDIRGDGGYVVVPPSAHPSGNRYEWITPLEGTELQLPPPWLLRVIESRTAAPRTTTLGPDGKVPHGQRHDWIASTAASLASRLPGISEDRLAAMLRTAVAEVMDTDSRTEPDILSAARSAVAKYGRPAPPPPTDTPPAPDHVVPKRAPPRHSPSNWWKQPNGGRP